MRLELARDLVCLGRTLCRAGMDAEAREQLDRAMQVFHGFGAEWDIAEALEIRSRLE
jgi:hypothetical protein